MSWGTALPPTDGPCPGRFPVYLGDDNMLHVVPEEGNEGRLEVKPRCRRGGLPGARTGVNDVGCLGAQGAFKKVFDRSLNGL